MYTVYADGHLLYHPELVNNGYGIYNPTINYEANKSGSFQFKMPVTNVMYNSLTKMSSIITVYQDSEEIFRGRVLNDDRDYYNNKSVYVEGELAFLLDSIVRPVEWNGTIANLFAHIINSHNEQVDASKRFAVGNCTVLADNEVTYSITDYSNSWNVINSYLMDVYGGYIRVRLENGTRYIDYIASYNSTSDQVIRFGDNLLDFNQHISGENVITRLIPLGAAYEIEKEDSEITPGTKIIDYESEPVGNKKKDNARTYIFAMEVLINSKNKSTEKTNVTVNFKVKTEANTISWSGQSASKLYAVIKTKTDKKTTERKKTGLASANWSTNFTTICTWTGDLKTGQTTITCEFVNNYSTKDNKPVSCGMSRYVDLLQQKSTRVDITSVNDGKDYIVNSQAEALFGQITGVQVWDDTDDPTALKTKGEEYLSENIALNVTLDVNAVDLNLVNVEYEKFKIGDRIRVVSAPHVLDEYFTCTAMSIDLQSPEQNSYTLGAEYKTLTETQIVNTNKLALTDEQINDIWEAVDEMNSVAEQANELIQTIYDNYADVTTVIENLDATYADIDFANISTAAIENLLATNAFIQALNAKYAEIDWANIDFAEIDSAKIQELLATNAAVQTLSAAYAEIDLANVDMANIAQATIQSLFANAAFIQELQTRYAKIDFANIGTAAIENLTTNHLNSIYADIDFAHITEAAIQRLFAGTGLVNNLVIEEGHVTGTLAGVRITGDVIDANTIKADSLILQGDDGVYYKLNIDGLNNISTSEAAKFTLLTAKPADWETNWKDYYQITNNEYVHLTSNTAPTWAANRYYKLSSLYESGLDGSNIVARSLTANQIAAGTITASELNISSARSGLGINDLETTVSGTVNSIAITYGYGTSTDTHPADSAFTYSDMPARSDNQYIWRKTVTSYVSGVAQTKYEMIQGVDGQDGQQGPQGNPGQSSYTFIRYSANSNGNPMSTTPNTYIGIYTGTSSTAPTSYTSYTWSKFQGTDGTSYYVWLRYSANSDGSNMTTSPTSTTKYIGVYSGTSSTAPTSASSYTWSKYIGEDGESITVSEVKYASSTSGTTAPSSGWQDTVPSVAQGSYLWTRTTYSDGTNAYTASRQGANGSSVTITSKAVEYQASSSGTTVPTGTWQTSVPSVSTGQYLWTRTTVNYSDGNSTVSYSVGYKGTNGTSVTISSKEIAYVKSDQGSSAPSSGWSTTFPTNLTNGDYLWTRTTVTYSSGGSTISYSVSYIGTNGTSPTAYDLRCSVYSVTKDTNNSDALSPTSVTFSSYSQTGNGTWGAYSGRFKIYTTTNNSTWTAVYTSSSNQSSYAYTVPSGIVGIKCELYLAGGTSTLVDSQTVPIISIGKNGTDGKDAYTVILTNESHTFAATSNGKAIAGNTQVNVIAYKGATQIAATIGTISGLPTGMTAPITSNGTTSAYFTPTVTTSMVTKTGVLTVPITVDGKSFTKKFSYSLAIAGTGISSIAYKYLATQNQNKPQASAVNLDSIPTLSPTNKYLWQKETITYNNGTTSENVTLIGVYGDTGVGVESVEPLYYLQDDGMNIVLNGNTKQTGKNLFDMGQSFPTSSSFTAVVSGNTLTLTATGTTGAQFTTAYVRNCDKSKSYVLSFKAKKVVKGTDGGPRITVNIYGSTDGGSTWSSLIHQVTTNPTQGTEYSLSSTALTGYDAYRFYIYNNTSTPVTVGEQTQYWNIQFENNTSATDYEPYFGGIPSPDYPMPIHSVSGDNTVTVTGKNIVPTTGWVQGQMQSGGAISNVAYAITSDYIPVNGGSTYTLSRNYVNIGAGSMAYHSFTSDKQYIADSGWQNNNATFTLDESVGYIRITTRQNTTTAITPDIVGNTLLVQLEPGSTATDYQLYQEQVFPITLPAENLFDFGLLANMGSQVEEISNGYRFVVTSTQYSTGVSVNLGSGSFYIKCKVNNISTVRGRVRVYYTDGTASDGTYSNDTAYTSSIVTNASKTISAIRLNWSTSGTMEITEFMVTKVDTETYWPYGKTVTFEQGALQDADGAETSLNTRIRTRYIPYSANTNFKIDVIASDADSIRCRKIHCYNSSKTWLGTTSNGYSTNFPVEGKTLANTAYIRVVCQYIDTSANITPSNKLLTVTSPSVTSYSPPIELNKIGDYADYFHQQEGAWYLHKEISTVDMGTLAWVGNSTYVGGWSAPVTGKAASTAVFTKYYPCLTNAFAWSQFNNYGDDIIGYASSSYVYVKDTTYTTSANFKASVNGVMLYYVLATAEEIEVTDTTLLGQLNAISQAMSYNGVTNILQENNDLPFNIVYNEQAGIAPDAPTPPVTSTTNAPDVWTKFTPAHIDGYRYYTCLQTKYDDNTYSVSDVVPDQELNEVHAQLKYIETQVTENHSLFEVLDDRISSQVTEITTVKGQVQDLNGTISETEQTLREEITSSSTQTASTIRDEFTTRIETIEGDVSNIEEVTTFFEKTQSGLLIGKSDSDIRMELDNDSLDFINKNDDVMAKLDANEGLVAAKLAVGSPTEGNKRWQFIAWGTDNTHLRIAKHN